jgi:hypothetical protein
VRWDLEKSGKFSKKIFIQVYSKPWGEGCEDVGYVSCKLPLETKKISCGWALGVRFSLLLSYQRLAVVG